MLFFKPQKLEFNKINKMEFRKLESIDKPVSKIVFGCAGDAFATGNNADSLLDAAFEAGFNTFDTAEVYGLSEKTLGKWIAKRHLRDEVVIITKGCHPHGGPRVDAVSLRHDIEQSLKRLKTDYIDIYMLHRDHPDCNIEEILSVLNEYIQKGKIIKIGVSNWTHERIELANRVAKEKGFVEFSSSSPNLSLARQVNDPWGGNCVSISGDKKAFEWYKQNKDIPVFAYSCLGRGLFSGKVKSDDVEGTRKYLDKYAIKGYLSDDNIERLAKAEKIATEKGCTVAQLSLAWLLQQEFDVYPIVSISKPERIEDNVKAIDIKLTKEEIEMLS